VTRHFPVGLDVRGRRCVVVGGGAVAARRVEGLLACGADVTVVAPRVAPPLQELSGAGRIVVHERPYAPGDLADAMLAIAATDVPAVNRQVAAEARAGGVLVNVASDPAEGDFVVLSVVRRGGLEIAISTGGESPALARRVREDLERLLPAEYGDLLPLLADLRRELRGTGLAIPAARWHEAADAEVLAYLREGNRAAAHARLRTRLTATE
jgi:siroheme synthase-like protein